ncbi:MAG: DNA cytosine methyltransferase [Sphingosinicella sp.]|nr:DNA cytosine methyltransferase [Sphingosinicella sp.]
MKFVSLFSGAGGLDLGLEQAGWDCLFATDFDPAAIATLNANRGFRLDGGRAAFGRSVIEQADIRQLSGEDMLAKIGMPKGSIPLLAGGPPCQSWSSAGQQRGFEDPRGRLVDDYLRIAAEIDARWLMFENVRGLLTARGIDGVPGSALARVRQSLFQHGWQTRVELLNAADYGIPQRRVRLILIGYRTGDAPELPRRTHASVPGSGLRAWVSLESCLGSIRRPDPEEVIRATGKMALDLQDLPAGTGAKSPGKAEATRPGGHWGYKQGAFIADPRLPNRTVTASAQQDWVRDPELGLRRLSPRECAAIQTFPANWVFCGKRTDQYRLVGNAVPPKLACRLGEALADHVSQDGAERVEIWEGLNPLPKRLQGAISYTMRDELRNGASRRAAVKRPLTTAIL